MIYLIHFHAPFKHAKHYIGFTETPEGLQARMDKHKRGSGSKLMAAVSKAGIDFSIVRTWPEGTRDQERLLKNRKEGPTLCPRCNPKANLLAKNLTVTRKSTKTITLEAKKSITCNGPEIALTKDEVTV